MVSVAPDPIGRWPRFNRVSCSCTSRCSCNASHWCYGCNQNLALCNPIPARLAQSKDDLRHFYDLTRATTMQATESCRNFPTHGIPSHGNRLRTLTIVGLAAMGVAYGGLWLGEAYPDTTGRCYAGESRDGPPVLRDVDG